MFKLKKITAITAIVAAMTIGGGLSDDAHAATITVSKTFAGENDCSGFFGTGFGACDIFVNDDTGKKIKLSPVIAKYDIEKDGLETEFNKALYPTIDGTEFSFDTSETGSWSYTPDIGDPGVKYWVAKGGNAFNLFWTVNEAATQTGGACDGGNLYTLACLSEALSVQGGLYATPINPKNGKNSGLSHLTFYNSEPPVVIPVPAAGVLLITALGGLGFAARRRRKSS